MSPRVAVREIPAARTRALRKAILRPQQREDELVYPGDEAPESLHLGAFANGELVGIASVYRESREDEPSDAAWRVRGMAVRPQEQGRGIGRALLDGCLEHARKRSGSLLWCTARCAAEGFYGAAGFQARGPVFELAGIGPHVLMARTI